MTAQELLKQASLGETYSDSPFDYRAPINLDEYNTIEIHGPTQEEAEAIRSLVFEAIENQNNTFTL